MKLIAERSAVVAAWIGAIALRPAPGQLAAQLGDPGAAVAAGGADVVIGDIAGAALWIACLWVALASSAVAGSRLPGTAGAMARAVARQVAPRVVRRALAAALGVGIAAAPGLAVADPAPSPSVSIAWPLSTDTVSTGPVTTGPTTTGPVTSGPVGPQAPTAQPASTDPASTDPASTDPASTDPASTEAPGNTRPADTVQPATSVLVRSGDTLWSIAAAALPPGATAADIAAAWPQWHQANAEAIGADPNLIRPGTVLQAPLPGDPR